MDVFADEDRAQLRLSVEKLTAEHFSFDKHVGRLRHFSDGWKTSWRMMAEAGWLGLFVPTEHGGLGGDGAELMILMDAAGAALVTEPLLSSAILCAPLIARLGTDAQRTMLAGLIDGRCVATLAHSEPHLGYTRWPIATKAAQGGTQRRLTGSKCAVLDGPIADVLLVSALDIGGEPALFLVRKEEPGLRLSPSMTIDERRVANLVLNDVPAERLGTGPLGDALDRQLDIATVAIGYEAAGAMARLIDMTADYLKQRQQFGQPLASFQVLRHRLVDMFIALEETRAMLDQARETLTAEPGARMAAVSAAKVLFARACYFIGQQAVQLHGGMGMTDALSVSHYFRRLTFLATWLGDADSHVERFRSVA